MSYSKIIAECNKTTISEIIIVSLHSVVLLFSIEGDLLLSRCQLVTIDCAVLAESLIIHQGIRQSGVLTLITLYTESEIMIINQ